MNGSTAPLSLKVDISLYDILWHSSVERGKPGLSTRRKPARSAGSTKYSQRCELALRLRVMDAGFDSITNRISTDGVPTRFIRLQIQATE